MRLSKLLCEAGMSFDDSIPDVEITEIVTDSRRASLGCMFICLSGGLADGHRYVGEALLRGAVAVIAEKGTEIELQKDNPYVYVIECENTRHAAAMLYSAWYGHPSKKLKIVGVTGTNGKTTVTHMLKRVFEGALYKCGVIGTVYCSSGARQIYARPDDPLANMTTPDPCQLYRLLAFMAADKVDYVFMEVSSHALKLCKTDAIEFDTAIFTNLSPDHLDFHKTMEDYAEAKAKLFRVAKRSIINGDDERSSFMESASPGRVYKYSVKTRGEINDFCAEGVINNGLRGINYTLRSKNTIMKLSSPIPGDFTVYNTLCVSACALLHGISPSVICNALSGETGVDGRMEKVRIDEKVDFSVFIDYAHTPDALENLLRSVNRFKSAGQRTVLLFGCGGDRDKTKRPVMGRIAGELADLVIVTSDNSRSENADNIISDIINGASEKSCLFERITDRRAAIEFAIKNARSGDVILLAGKGHEKYEIDSNGKREFDEKRIVAELVRKYYSN